MEGSVLLYIGAIKHLMALLLCLLKGRTAQFVIKLPLHLLSTLGNLPICLYRQSTETNKDGVVITGRRRADRYPVNETSSLSVFGDRSLACDIMFGNTTGVGMQQAIDLLVASDKSAFYHCSVKGYKDTLFTNFSDNSTDITTYTTLLNIVQCSH